MQMAVNSLSFLYEKLDPSASTSNPSKFSSPPKRSVLINHKTFRQVGYNFGINRQSLPSKTLTWVRAYIGYGFHRFLTNFYILKNAHNFVGQERVSLLDQGACLLRESPPPPHLNTPLVGYLSIINTKR